MRAEKRVRTTTVRSHALSRALFAAGLLIATACAKSGAGPAWQSWVPGSYDFRAVGAMALTGTIEIDSLGPTAVSTSAGKCFEGQPVQIRNGRDRQFVFNCSDKIHVTLQTGYRSEPPIVGWAGDSRTETYVEVTGRKCIEYSEPNASDERVCTSWEDLTRTVTKQVGRAGTIELMAYRPAVSPR